MPTSLSNSAAAETPRPTLPALSDPKSVESELSAKDWAQDHDRPQGPTAEDLVKLVTERKDASVAWRKPLEPHIFLPMAFYLGQQHLGWSTNGGKLVDTRDLAKGWKQYSVRNKIKPKVQKLQAKALEVQPDPSFRPTRWESAIDRLAAAEARAVRAHLCRKYDEDLQIADEILWTAICGIAVRKYSWDPTLEAEVPDYDARGQLTGTRLARVGDIARETIPIADLYPDPKARIVRGQIKRCAWLIHSHVRDVQDVQDHYGEAALGLDPEVPAGQDGFIESRMNSLVGQSSGNAQSTPNALVVDECWEWPSIRFPKGRLIVIGGGRLLRYEAAWPTPKRDAWPFVPMTYSNPMGGFIPHGAVWDAIGAQRTYNRAMSALDEALESPWGKWLVPRNAGIGGESLNDPGEAVYHAPGFVPQRLDPLPVADVVKVSLDISDQQLDDHFGVHDVSDGQAPKEVTAASALEILRQQDTSQQKGFFVAIDTFVRLCAEQEIALASAYYTVPRLMAIQDVAGIQDAEQQGNPIQPSQGGGYGQVMAFRALTGAGSCHVVMEAGSRAPLSPVARLQLVQQLYTQGFFGPAGDPRASMIALEMMDEIRSDALIERLIQLRQQMQQEAQQAAQAEGQAQQQQAAAKQDLQAAQQRHDQTMTLMQARIDAAQKATDQAAQAAQAAQERGHQAEMRALDMAGKLESARAAHVQDLTKLGLTHGHERTQPPRLAVSGSMTPQETHAVLDQAGIHAPEPTQAQMTNNHSTPPAPKPDGPPAGGDAHAKHPPHA